MKKLLILLLVSSCSLFTKKPDLSESAQGSPTWLYAPYDFCNEKENLCAVGEARTMSAADSEARASLGSIFEVKIQTELSVQSSTTGSVQLASVREEVQKSLNESVSQVLELVEITKRHKQHGLTYSLASLNREKASDLIYPRLQKLDQEIESLWRTRQRTNFRKLVKLNLEREKLHDKYQIVSGSTKAPSVTYAEILKWKESRPNLEAISLKVGQSPDWLTLKIKEILTESGFRVVKGDADKVISISVESIKEYLNVNGFEKYTFTLNLISLKAGEKHRVVSTSETVTGRSQADALLKIKSYFLDYIEQHLSDLDLD